MRWPLWVVMKFVTWMPVILAYGALLYFALLGYHLASNPKVFVRLFFGAIDLVPAYFDFVVKEIIDELRAQLSARLR